MMLAVPFAVGLVDNSTCVGSLLVSVNVSEVGGAAPRLIDPTVSRLFPRFWFDRLMVGAVTVGVICVRLVPAVLYPAGTLGVAMLIVLVPAVDGWKLIPPALVAPFTVNVTVPPFVIVPTAVLELLNVTVTEPPPCGPTLCPHATGDVNAALNAHILADNGLAVENVVVVKLPWLISNAVGTTVMMLEFVL